MVINKKFDGIVFPCLNVAYYRPKKTALTG